jgi:hypothetical protein
MVGKALRLERLAHVEIALHEIVNFAGVNRHSCVYLLFEGRRLAFQITKSKRMKSREVWYHRMRGVEIRRKNAFTAKRRDFYRD